MYEEQIERKKGRIITMYMPVFKDKLVKLENRGLGHSDEAQRLRSAIAVVETRTSPSQADGHERRSHVGAE